MEILKKSISKWNQNQNGIQSRSKSKQSHQNQNSHQRHTVTSLSCRLGTNHLLHGCRQDITHRGFQHQGTSQAASLPTRFEHGARSLRFETRPPLLQQAIRSRNPGHQSHRMGRVRSVQTAVHGDLFRRFSDPLENCKLVVSEFVVVTISPVFDRLNDLVHRSQQQLHSLADVHVEGRNTRVMFRGLLTSVDVFKKFCPVRQAPNNTVLIIPELRMQK